MNEHVCPLAHCKSPADKYSIQTFWRHFITALATLTHLSFDKLLYFRERQILCMLSVRLESVCKPTK